MGWGQLGKSRNAAFRAFQDLVAAGEWTPIWRAVVARAEEEGFSAEQLGRASAWLLKAGAIEGGPEDWPAPPPPPPKPEKPKWKATPAPSTKARVSDALWAKVGPLWEGALPPRKSNIGALGADPRHLLDLVIEKFRTGIAWDHPLLAGNWQAAHKRHRALSKSGRLAELWRGVLEHADELGLSWREQLAATRWMIHTKALTGKPSDYGVAEPPESVRVIKKERQPPKPRAKRPPHETIWEVPDELWERVMPRLEQMFPRHRPGLGRPRADFRQVMDAAIWFSRVGGQWKAMRNLFGIHYSTVHKWLRRWQAEGVLQAIREELIREAEAMGLVDFSYQVMDGSHAKSRQGGECVSVSPVDRAKGGIKRSLLVERNGYPIAMMVAPANIHDKELVKETLARAVRPSAANAVASQTLLLLDRGYSGRPVRAAVEAAGYVYRAPPRNDDDPYWLLDTPLTPEEKRIRARVEVCHAWMASFRAVLVRNGYKKWSYEAVCELAMILIWWRRVSEANRKEERESPREVAGAA